MRHTIIATTMICVLSSTLSIASPFSVISAHNQQNKHALSEKINTIKNDDKAYPNFSGQWQGICEETPITLTIDQMGKWFFIKYDIEGRIIDEQFEIGALNTHSTSASIVHQIEHSYAYWNKNNKNLVIDDVNIQKNTSAMFSYTGISQTTLAVENNQLTIQATSHSFEDGEVFGPLNLACTFSKIK